jgi:hypothetical protein
MATSPVAVDYNPFASNQSDNTDSPVPVDYDPFAAAPAPATAAPKPSNALADYGSAMLGTLPSPEFSKGALSGVAQTVTGIGEMQPGFIGDISAKGTKALKEIGEPEAQTGGNILTGLFVGAPSAAAKLGVEGATKVGNILRGVKSGGITGGLFGLTTPTGKEDVEERLIEKGESAGLGALLGGPLGGIAGAFAPRGTSPSELLRQYAGSLKEGGFAKDVIDGLASAEKSIQTSLEQQIRSIEASVPQKVDKLYRDVSGRLFDLYENAQKQADLIREKGGAQAQEVADSVLNAARQQIQRARNLADEAVARATTRQTTAQAGLKQIGDPSKELTDTLKPIRDRAVSREEGIIRQQKEADDVLRTARDKIVVDNEAAGITIDQMPSYRQLAETVAPFDPARAPDLLKNTDPSKVNLFNRIRESALNKRVELTKDQAEVARSLGYDVSQDGSKFYRNFKTSFEAIDDARRFVGQIFKKEIAGYEAISGIEKQNLYALLSRIEEEYVGKAAQKELQANWANARNALDALEGKSGKTLLQLEEGTQAFNKPTAELGQYFFSSQDRVQNLVDLTGDAATVRKVAGDYVANQLRAQDSKGVQRFLNDPKNSDWLSHPALQGLKTDLTQYAQRLARAETAQSAATKLTAKPIKTDTGRTTPSSYLAKQEAAAETARTKALTQAEQEATGVITEAEQLGKKVEAGAGKREEAIKKEAETAKKAFASAMSTGGGKIKQEYEGLKRYADMVLEAERTAKPGQPPTTYTYSNLIQQMKSFLNERALDGTVPQDILLRESQKLDQIAATQSSELKAQLLRENLKMLAGQAGVVATGRVGHLPGLLKTTGRVLGGGL